MLSDLIDRLLNRSSPKSRNEVKRRLQQLLAHDRTTLSPKELEAIQAEILEVVSRYVELDQDGLEFALASDQRLTSLVANLPIRRIKSDDKDGAAKRVAEIPQEDASNEPVPDNMTLDLDDDEAEIFKLDLDPELGDVPASEDSTPGNSSASA